MVWRGASLLSASKKDLDLNKNSAWLIFLGTLGIALNGVLYGIDMYLYPIPRDLVIHSYYLGQLGLVFGQISNQKID